MTQDMIVQFADTDKGPSAYARLAPDQLLLGGIDYTLASDGPFAGVPALSLRLAGCNRGSKFMNGCDFCATDFRFARGKPLTFRQIEEQMIETSGIFSSKRLLVVLSGGEPMLQPHLVHFLHYLIAHNWSDIVIESNGDALAKNFSALAKDHITLIVSPRAFVSYKLPDEAILYAADYLKFMISSEAGPYYDVPLSYVAAWSHLNRDSSTIFVAPINVYARPLLDEETPWLFDQTVLDMGKTRINYRRAAILAKERGYRVALQTPLFLGLS